MKLRWYLLTLLSVIFMFAMFHQIGVSIETGDKETGLTAGALLVMLSGFLGFILGFYLQEGEV